MTMPSSNINLITDVRNGFMQDSSGDASLNSTKYRDGAGKGTGNVALTDFANTGWRQGRNLLHQPSASQVKPYVVEGGVDNSTYYDNRFKINIVNGLPEWEMESYQVTWEPSRVAWYMSSGFKCLRPGISHTFGWTVFFNMYDYTGGQPKFEYLIRGYSSGYKSGSSQQYVPWTHLSSSTGTGTDRSYTKTFTPSSSYPYILISTRMFFWENEQLQRINGVLKNMRVTV